MTAKRQKKAPAVLATVAYCGPTLPGVAKQYTFFTGGTLPAALEAAKEKTPAQAGLLVPLEELPAALPPLREHTGPIYALYRAVQGNR